MNDSQDPDGLSEFAPEPGAETTARVKTRAAAARARSSRPVRPRVSSAAATNRQTPAADAGEAREAPTSGAEEKFDDWLAVFTTEPRSDAAPRARADAFGSSDDDLNQFAPDQYVSRSSRDEDDFLDQFGAQPRVAERPGVSAPLPAAVVRSQPWAGPWAAAVVAVVICVLLGTRSFYPAWWNAGRQDVPPRAASNGERAAVSSTPPAPALAPAPKFATPAVEPGIRLRTLRQFETVPVGVPPLAIANARPTRPTPETAPAVARMSPPIASRSEIARPATARTSSMSPGETAFSAQRTDRVPVVDTVPLRPETLRTPLLRETALTPLTLPNTSESAVQEYAVRQALTSYEKAYEGLDVGATAAVWPSVDRRALARAFDSLVSQGLEFQSCAITVSDSSAIARCRGTLRLVRKVGNSVPLTAEQEWVFKMRRLGADWKIDTVAASQASGQAAPRTPSQG